GPRRLGRSGCPIVSISASRPGDDASAHAEARARPRGVHESRQTRLVAGQRRCVRRYCARRGRPCTGCGTSLMRASTAEASRSDTFLDRRIYHAAIAFVLGMAELIIGGILDLVALDLGVSVGRAGLLITVFALVFGVGGPVLLFLAGRADRKRVTLAALSVFIVGNLVAVASTTYGALMLSRIITAASGALLTVLCLALAAQISKPGYRGRAIGIVVMGISGSLVLGLPTGVSLGHAYGWRSPFVLVAVLALLL